MHSSTSNKKISRLEAIDIICDEWQKGTNNWSEEGYIEKETLKSYLIKETNRKFILATDDLKQFRQALKKSLEKLKDENLNFKNTTYFFIEELFTKKEKNRFLAGFDDNQAFLTVLTPFLIFVLSLIISKIK